MTRGLPGGAWADQAGLAGEDDELRPVTGAERCDSVSADSGQARKSSATGTCAGWLDSSSLKSFFCLSHWRPA